MYTYGGRDTQICTQVYIKHYSPVIICLQRSTPSHHTTKYTHTHTYTHSIHFNQGKLSSLKADYTMNCVRCDGRIYFLLESATCEGERERRKEGGIEGGREREAWAITWTSGCT